MGTTSGHEAGVEAQAFSEGHTSGGEVMLEAFQPQENGEALAPVEMNSFHSSEDDMFGMGGRNEHVSLWRNFRGIAAWITAGVLYIALAVFSVVSPAVITGFLTFMLVKALTDAFLGATLGIAAGAIVVLIGILKMESSQEKKGSLMRKIENFCDRIEGVD